MPLDTEGGGYSLFSHSEKLKPAVRQQQSRKDVRLPHCHHPGCHVFDTRQRAEQCLSI